MTVVEKFAVGYSPVTSSESRSMDKLTATMEPVVLTVGIHHNGVMVLSQ